MITSSHGYGHFIPSQVQELDENKIDKLINAGKVTWPKDAKVSKEVTPFLTNNPK